MAGIATMAPTGTTASPARTSATRNGSPAPPLRWPIMAAPDAGERGVAEGDLSGAPDQQTQGDEDGNRATAFVYSGSFAPTTTGASPTAPDRCDDRQAPGTWAEPGDSGR